MLLRLRDRPRPLLVLAAALSGGAFLAAASSGCARDHGLGIETTTSSATGASTGAVATTATSSAGAGGMAATSTSGGAGTGGDDEPQGPTRVTVVNGVNDYDAIRLCFLPYPGGDPGVKPWPAAATGLSFAHAQTVDLAADIPASADIRTTVLAGDLASIAGKTCSEAIALANAAAADGGAAGSLVAADLPVLPAAVFTSNRSVLLAPLGCLGGPGHADPSATLACGFAFSASTPTIDLVALGMSRKTDPVHLALQVVNASVALQPTDVGITPSVQGAANQELATSLPTGSIEPRPPSTALTLTELGALDTVSIKTYSPGQSPMFITSDTPLHEAFQNGTVAKAELENGGAYVLVAVGSYPGIPASAFGHKLTYSLIKANP